MTTQAFPANAVNLFPGTPADALAGNMSITMKTARYYTDGTRLAKGSTYSVTRIWGKMAVEQGWAADTNKVLPLQDSPRVGPYTVAQVVVVTGLTGSTVYDDVIAKNNALALKTAMDTLADTGGTIYIPAGGPYYVCSANPATDDRILSIYSRMFLDGAPGTRLIAPPGTDQPCVPLLVNFNYRSVKRAVTSLTSSTSSAPFVTTVTATIPNHGQSPGKFIQIKDDTSGYYNGVWEVVTTPTANLLTWQMYGFAAAPPNGAGTIIMYPADARFEISSNITIDGNLNGNTGGYLGELGKMAAIFNKCADYTIKGSFIRAAKYGIYYCNSIRATFDLGTPQGPSSAIQAGGPVSQIKMKGMFALLGDDVFPLITDNAGYTFYDLRDADGATYALGTKSSDGDITDILIEKIQEITGGSRNIVLAGSTYAIRRVMIQQGQHASSLAGLYTYIDGVAGQTLTLEDVFIDGYQLVSGNNPFLFIGGTAGCTINFKNINLSNISNRGASVGGTPTGFAATGLVTFGPATVVGDGLYLTRADIDADLVNAGTQGVALYSIGGGGVCTLKNVCITDSTLRGSGAVRAVKGITLNANANVETIQLTNVRIRGNAASLIDDGSTQAGTTTVQISNSYTDQGSATNGQCGILTAGGRSMNVSATNVQAVSALSGFFNVYGGTGKTYELNFAQVRCSHRLIVNGASTHTINFRSGGGNSSINFGKSSGFMLQNTGVWTMNLLDNCADIGIDADLIARQDGTIFYNTKSSLGTLGAAGLVVGQGTAANSWRLMGDPTKQY